MIEINDSWLSNFSLIVLFYLERQFTSDALACLSEISNAECQTGSNAMKIYLHMNICTNYCRVDDIFVTIKDWFKLLKGIGTRSTEVLGVI